MTGVNTSVGVFYEVPCVPRLANSARVIVLVGRFVEVAT